MTVKLNDEVKSFWEQEACGSSKVIVGNLEPLTKDWYERIEQYRYEVEPFIFSVAQFSRHAGKKLLEVGVGAGTDHLQWARSGVECHGVDLTDAALETTRNRFDIYGYKSNLQRLDAETLPFPDKNFDIVYSWGVIHHSENPELIVSEIRRVLKSGGVFIGMMYGRRSLFVLKLWIKHALLKMKPWLSFADVVWDRVESVGTKSYTPRELSVMFSEFKDIELIPILAKADVDHWPRWLSKFFPASWGWYIGVRARK